MIAKPQQDIISRASLGIHYEKIKKKYWFLPYFQLFYNVFIKMTDHNNKGM